MSLPDPLARLVEQLQKLPGIGAKSAQRLAFHVLRHPREDAERLCEAIRDVKERVTYCSTCNNITDTDPCAYCTSATRDQRLICVVEEPQNVTVVEKTREFRGVYHVLMGALSPLQGVGPDDLKIKGLLTRVGAGGVDEVILATNPTVEGEATALYLARLLKPLGVRVTRIAMGIPVGSDLEYADEVTMTRAMEGRRDCSHRSIISSPLMLPPRINFQQRSCCLSAESWPASSVTAVPPRARDLRLHPRRARWPARCSAPSDTGPMLIAAAVGGLLGAGILYRGLLRRRRADRRRARRPRRQPGVFGQRIASRTFSSSSFCAVAGAVGVDVPPALLHHRRHRRSAAPGR